MKDKDLLKLIRRRKILLKEERGLLVERLQLNKQFRLVRSELNSLDSVLVNEAEK